MYEIIGLETELFGWTKKEEEECPRSEGFLVEVVVVRNDC